MDIRAVLNSDQPQPSPSPSARHPPPHNHHSHHNLNHHQHHRPAPPPLQPPLQHPPLQPPPRSPFQSPIAGGYPHHQSQPLSPYRPSPTSSTQQFPFPHPPPSPHAQQHQHPHPYGQSPVTPHPLSASSNRHSVTPTSSVSAASSRDRFSPTATGQLNHYGHPPQHQHPQQHPQHQSQQQPQYQQQQHQIQLPPSPHPYHPQHPQQQHPAYPRQSPLASPIGTRPSLAHTGSSGNFIERPTPTISAPMPREQRDMERAGERERGLEREQERERGIEREQEAVKERERQRRRDLEREREELEWERKRERESERERELELERERGRERELEREREQEREQERERQREHEREREREDRERRERAQRERERDISVSPKTKLPVYLPGEDSVLDGGVAPKEEFGYPGSRLNSHHLPDASGGYAGRDPSVARSPTQEGRNVDMMDIDGTAGAGPGSSLTPKRKWGSPVTERTNPNGSVSTDGRDVQGQQHHMAPQQPPPPQPPLSLPSNNNNNTYSQQPSSQPSSASSSQRTSTVSPSIKEQPHQPPSQPKTSTPTPAPTSLNSRPQPPSPTSKPPHQLGPPPAPTQNQVAVEGGNSGSPGASGPPRKRPRRDEAPIWARKASRSSSSSPVMANRRQPSSAGQHQPPPQQQQQSPPPLPPPPPPPLPPPPQHKSFPGATHSFRVLPAYGPWEPSISNAEPHEELSREIADFLYHQVVCRNDPALINTDGPAAVIEIEAKIGHLIDKATGQRLALPVITETVMDGGDTNWRIQFKSSMTEAQHKRFNIVLNGFFAESKSSHPPGPPPSPSSEHPPEHSRQPSGPPTRIPMDYVHLHERDSFFELPPEKSHALPATMRAAMNPRHRARVRVTTDQKSGKVLSKIVKTRIADLNVYSPKTAFDWRVSVNMEMPYSGKMDGLQPVAAAGEGYRSKDRLSYRHLAYQIDLTQVTDNTSRKEHELEVEVTGHEIRKHGLLAKEGKPNGYEALVRGFVDNVRLLVRAVDPV